MTAPEDDVPPDYLIVGFGDARQIRPGFARLAGLAAEGEIALVDVEFIHSIHGVASTVTAASVDHDLTAFDAHATGLLRQSDLDAVADAIPPGSTAAVVVYRDGPILPALAQFAADGATIVGEGVFRPGTGLAASD